MRPRVLAASMDLLCFYRGRSLLGRYAFCDLWVGQKLFSVLKVSYSVFNFLEPDFEAILLSTRELSLV